MNNVDKKKEAMLFGEALLGVCIFAIAYKYFVVPSGLYSGGFTGISQIITNIIREINPLINWDTTGAIYWMLNIPLFILGYRELGRGFMVRTILAVSIQSFLMVILPEPTGTFFQEESMNCIVGGALAGTGIGFMLRAGSSSGGADILGLYMVKKHADFSVGRISLIMDILIFGYAAIQFNYRVAAYSIVFAFVSAFMTDRAHYQNIKLSVFVVSKVPDIGKEITNVMNRGVTTWNGWGEYSHEINQVHMIVMNKYELNKFRKLMKTLDPSAFIWVSSPDMVMGNFESRMGV